MFALSPLIIGISAVTYMAVVQLSEKLSLGRVFSSLTVVMAPMTVLLLQRFVYISGADLPVSGNLLTWADAASMLVQFIVALYIFTKLDQNDSYATWIAWVVVGLVTIVLTVPMLIRSLVTF